MENVTLRGFRNRASRNAGKSLPCTVRLTERDLWLLEALAKMRFLTTGQITRLFFGGSQWSANKRLRKLFDAGFLKVWMRSLSEENVYSVTSKGLCVLKEDQQGEESFNGSAPRGLDGNLDHLLAINEVRVGLAVGLCQIGGEISWWKSDWELRSHGRAGLIPDALFSIKWAAGEEQVFSLELDRNTKSPAGFLRKLLRYASFLDTSHGLYGFKDFLILVVGKDPRWVERYRQSASRSRLGKRIWFTAMKELEERGVANRIWLSTEGDEKYSLRDLSFLPYGKEGSGAKSTEFT